MDSLSTLREEALHMHKVHQGKLETVSKVKVENAKDLSLAYSPGVAEPCKEIYDDKSKVYEYTMKGNMVAVVTDGTAVLGLGNIGPEASLPVMEGKAVLFKSFAGVDAFPIALNTGIAIIKLLYRYGVRDIIMCDRKGAIYEGRPTGMNPVKDEVAKYTNKNRIEGSLADVVQGADVFIGVSAEGALTEEMVRTMNDDAIIFAMANPVPEIMPELAKAAGAAVVGTGRSDFANQVNNVLAFPGIFRGALDVHATQINEEMKMAAVQAIAELVAEDELNADYIIPAPFDARVAPQVAAYVAKAAMETGVARRQVDPNEVAEKTKQLALIGKE